jgi:hypothetical protein
MQHNEHFIHVMTCQECMQAIKDYLIRMSASHAGSTLSDKKSKAARLNGMKGGRPPNKKKAG